MKAATKEPKKRQIIPLGDRVLVRLVDKEVLSPGGIVIVESAQEKPQEGIVVAVGTDARYKDGTPYEFHVKVGDKVAFTQWAGSAASAKSIGEGMAIMQDSDILAIIKD